MNSSLEEDEDLMSEQDELNRSESIIDPLTWQQHFKNNEQVILLDLKNEYKNVLRNLGENSHPKERAEQFYKLLKTKKLTWWMPNEPDIHEILKI